MKVILVRICVAVASGIALILLLFSPYNKGDGFTLYKATMVILIFIVLLLFSISFENEEK